MWPVDTLVSLWRQLRTCLTRCLYNCQHFSTAFLWLYSSYLWTCSPLLHWFWVKFIPFDEALCDIWPEKHRLTFLFLLLFFFYYFQIGALTSSPKGGETFFSYYFPPSWILTAAASRQTRRPNFTVHRGPACTCLLQRSSLLTCLSMEELHRWTTVAQRGPPSFSLRHRIVQLPWKPPTHCSQKKWGLLHCNWPTSSETCSESNCSKQHNSELMGKKSLSPTEIGEVLQQSSHVVNDIADLRSDLCSSLCFRRLSWSFQETPKSDGCARNACFSNCFWTSELLKSATCQWCRNVSGKVSPFYFNVTMSPCVFGGFVWPGGPKSKTETGLIIDISRWLISNTS